MGNLILLNLNEVGNEHLQKGKRRVSKLKRRKEEKWLRMRVSRNESSKKKALK